MIKISVVFCILWLSEYIIKFLGLWSGYGLFAIHGLWKLNREGWGIMKIFGRTISCKYTDFFCKRSNLLSMQTLRFSMLLAFSSAVVIMSSLSAAQAQNSPLKLVITDGVIEPLPFAISQFVAESPKAADVAREITRVIAADLAGTGLFREVPASSHISRVTNFESPIAYAEWKAVNAQALITGAVGESAGGITVKFRLFDVFIGKQIGEGLQFSGQGADWRRIAHKVADVIYTRLTGESGYFDSRVVFVSEAGPKNARQKRLAIMDYDGANISYLTDGGSIVLAPRISPKGDKVIFTSYQSGFPQVMLMDIASSSIRPLTSQQQGIMTFAPRFSPDGQRVVYSLERGGNSDIYVFDIASGRVAQLTNAPSIETSPSFSPDGRKIVFESDRSGQQQLYIMSAEGGAAQRISNGPGRYASPVWSPRGDLIAFTKQNAGRFHIGVMRVDGSEERLLSASYLDESPSWSPNGRVLMFTRQTPGAQGQAQIYSVDITGRNLKQVPTSGAASDPAWSPLLP